MTETNKTGHPPGLSSLFFTEMWERFSYYGMRAILTIFLTAELATGGFGMDRKESLAIYGLFTALVYLDRTIPDTREPCTRQAPSSTLIPLLGVPGS